MHVIPDYDPMTITYAPEPFVTDAHANPSESLNLDHLARVIAARRENEVAVVREERSEQ